MTNILDVDSVEYIARISFGKDSLKMLDVIISRQLRLDRITTTDVWATDTIRAEFPDVLEAKERIEEWIWQRYRMDVDHLCARNKDGSKRTYEQMFYHVPKRRSQTVQVERERETGSGPAQSEASRICGTSGASQTSSGIPNYRVQGTITGHNNCQKLKLSETHIKGFPLNTGGCSWCQQLKTRVFRMPYHEGQEKKDRGVPGYCCRRAG